MLNVIMLSVVADFTDNQDFTICYDLAICLVDCLYSQVLIEITTIEQF
jgi:hypothetical protein